MGRAVERKLAVREKGEVLIIDFEKDFDRVSLTTYYWMDSAYFGTSEERLLSTSSRLDLCSITTYKGNRVLQMSTSKNSWDGPYWMKPCPKFDFYTNTFTFKIRQTNSHSTFESKFAVDIVYNSSHLDNTTRIGVSLQINTSSEVSLGDSWYLYTATLPSGYTTNNVRCFEFKTARTGLGAYYVDDICAINPNA